ncbi:MAG: phage major capsid protein [Cycloclasticus sp.]|nr:phage major capsid protein [Cycloclasticus sp.]
MSEELNKIVAKLGGAFDEFKAENDKRLDEIESKGKADPLLENKVNAINAAVGELSKEKDRLDKIEAALNRGDLGGGGGANEEQKAQAEHKKAFGSYFRKGIEGDLRNLEVNASLSTQVDEDGGFFVPEEVDTEIGRVLQDMGAMRSLARVQPIGSATFKRLHNMSGATSGWVGEEEGRIKTGTPKLKELAFQAMELYAEPATTQGMLDDSAFNVEQWLADEIALEFSEQESNAFITGDGIKKPRGLLSYNAIANGSEKFGELGFIASGAAGAFNGSDALIDLFHSVKRGYRANANWMMNDLTFAAIRKLKDGNGDYLFKPGLMEGETFQLLGKGVEIDDFMPDLAANSLSIAFGDFRRGYMIVDRMGVRVLRDAYTSKPYIKFYTTKRVGGGLNDSNAIKLMKFTV